MTIPFRNRHRLKRKQIAQLLSTMQSKFSIKPFDDHTPVDIAQYENQEIILINDSIDFFIYQDTTFFTLKGLNKYKPQDYFVIVDMGTIRFLTNGADIMTPGIVNADTKINQGDLVWIADETHWKPLGVGEALINGEDMIQKTKGKAIKNIHHIGDKLWQISHETK